MTYLIEYLGEFEFIFETILDYESGDQMGSFDTKKPPSKISCLGTFKPFYIIVFKDSEVLYMSSRISSDFDRYSAICAEKSARIKNITRLIFLCVTKATILPEKIDAFYCTATGRLYVTRHRIKINIPRSLYIQYDNALRKKGLTLCVYTGSTGPDRSIRTH